MISFECNNPFNIRYDANNCWKGQVGQIRGFVEFRNLELGIRAGLLLVKNYVKRGFSLREFVYRYAPPSENNSVEYLGYICASLCKFPDDILMDKDIIPLSKYIIMRECSLDVLIKSLKDIAKKYEIL